MSEVDIFLIGVPKAGTTWLAHTLNQHPGIVLSEPKEPNIIASHKGTFIRSVESPEWNKFETCFQGEGLRLDASIHAFSCPLAASRIKERIPDAKFILCLREPVSRSFSHWNMVLNTKESKLNGADWETFEKAWSDERLRIDSMYGTSMKNWLKEFSLDRFLIIDSAQLRANQTVILEGIENFLQLDNYNFEFSHSRHSNSAAKRRPITGIGKLTRTIFSIIPTFIKSPIVRILQKRDLNIYNLPVLSTKGISHNIDSSDFKTCGNELLKELELFQSISGFDTTHWREEINHQLNLN